MAAPSPATFVLQAGPSVAAMLFTPRIDSDMHKDTRRFIMRHLIFTAANAAEGRWWCRVGHVLVHADEAHLRTSLSLFVPAAFHTSWSLPWGWMGIFLYGAVASTLDEGSFRQAEAEELSRRWHLVSHWEPFRPVAAVLNKAVRLCASTVAHSIVDFTVYGADRGALALVGSSSLLALEDAVHSYAMCARAFRGPPRQRDAALSAGLLRSCTATLRCIGACATLNRVLGPGSSSRDAAIVVGGMGLCVFMRLTRWPR